jgi:murein DD-endopeptidase MepM/ murein hydrolase activator NlpD
MVTMDIKRHVPQGRRRVQLTAHSRGRSHVYLGRTSRPLGDIYASDHADSRQGGRFRWLVSTCLAGAVGVLAILVVIAGSSDNQETAGGLLTSLRRVRAAPILSLHLPSARVDGLSWATPKADRLLIPNGAMATTFVVLDPVRQRRGNRDYIMNKPYARLVARLGPISKAQAQHVPPLNPFKLYANTTPLDAAERPQDGQQNVSVALVELLSGALPIEDHQELTGEEVAEFVARVQAGSDDPLLVRGPTDNSAAAEADPSAEKPKTELPPNTTDLAKSVIEAEDPVDDMEGREVRVVRTQRGDTLSRVLVKMGAEAWQARAMADAARSVFPDGALAPGLEMHVTLVPSVLWTDRMEPIRFSVYGEGQDHKVTVTRNAAGEFVAKGSPLDERLAAAAELSDADQPHSSSLYASLYSTAQRQGVPSDAILQILKIHAYETDFRQRVRVGDGFEFFFDMKEEEKGGDATNFSELLATAVTAAGESHRFYRFRAPDGGVDYYDDQGNTSRKFLMRRPVRGEDVRLTSGFGVRRHPILQIPKMHTGVDWACAFGTPIMAAGSGVIEEAGRKGEYGNYIRIRHANGYKTAYGHMSRFGAGVSEGVKVRQGQIIGYVGSTGISSGPHVHFEVLVNNSFVDPNSIQVPREQQLSGRALVEFQKERARIDELMRRNPVSTKVASASDR